MTEIVTEYKLKKDINSYVKMGLDERTAVVVACGVNGVPDRAVDILAEMGDEQAELRKCLKDMVAVADQLEMVKKENGDNDGNDDSSQKNISDDNIEDVKNEESNIEH